MASEIRVNNIKALTGLGTVTVSADGLNVGGIVTATSFSGPIVGDVGIADTIYHVGDTDTRIRFPAADTFTVETAGSEALRVDSNSGVGVADSIFHLEDTNTAIRFPAADTFTVETSGSEALRVDSSGHVLVGTNAEVTSSTHAKIQAASTGGAFLVLARNDTSVSNNNIGLIRFYGNDDDGNYEECAQIACVADGTHATGDKPSYLSFQTTADGASSPTERVRVTSTGGVHFNNAEFIERVNITAGKISDNLQVSLDNGMVHYFTTTETTTSDPNIVSTAGINTSMATGDTMAVTLINTAAAAGYSPRIKIDGVYTGITTHWSGGSAPTEGSSSGSDVYAYQIVKTGDAAYRVFASFTNFA